MTTPTRPDLVLLDFDAWANERLFDACEALDDESLDRTFEMGLGSLRATFAHDLGAMIGWTGVLRGEEDPFAVMRDDPPRTIEAFRLRQREANAAFRAAALDGDFSDVITREREGTTYTFTRGGILAHVTTHSMHHRAQCINMLRQLGITDSPESSVFQWMNAHPPEA